MMRKPRTLSPEASRRIKGACCIAAPPALVLAAWAAYWLIAEPLRGQLDADIMKTVDETLYVIGALAAIAVFICTPIGLYLIATKPMPKR